jgi:TIR domain
VVTSLQSSIGKQERTVFLIYARTDFATIRRVADGLSSAGMRVWLDEADLKPGTNWMQEIERELSGANFVVFFISPASVESQLASLEFQVALHRQVHGEGGAVILPVLLEDADAPPLLRQFQWVDLRDGDIEKGVGRLIRRIRGKARRQPQPPFRTRQGRVETAGASSDVSG